MSLGESILFCRNELICMFRQTRKKATKSIVYSRPPFSIVGQPDVNRESHCVNHGHLDGSLKHSSDSIQWKFLIRLSNDENVKRTISINGWMNGKGEKYQFRMVRNDSVPKEHQRPLPQSSSGIINFSFLFLLFWECEKERNESNAWSEGENLFKTVLKMSGVWCMCFVA